ncbi:MAG: WhiB family transcriptional regulator [Actinomycetota bacterium]|nr:WhiB family transcriptional regulator [Actinomycetota bacterium]
MTDLATRIDGVDLAVAVTVLLADEQMPWVDDAACRGESELFFAPFAERPEARVRREAKANELCDACPVAGLCKEYARENRELGYWGGESESERATAGFAPTTPIIGRRQVAAQRAAAALARAI